MRGKEGEDGKYQIMSAFYCLVMTGDSMYLLLTGVKCYVAPVFGLTTQHNTGEVR